MQLFSERFGVFRVEFFILSIFTNEKRLKNFLRWNPHMLKKLTQKNLQ